MAETEEWEAAPVSYPFLNRVTFTMPENYVDWDVVDKLDDSEPSSREYRRLMREIGISGRPIRSKNRRARWDDDD